MPFSPSQGFVSVGNTVEAWLGEKIIQPNYRPFAKRGGIEFEPMTFRNDTLRAELVELANQISFQHAGRIVDVILARYDVKRKPLKEKKT